MSSCFGKKAAMFQNYSIPAH